MFSTLYGACTWKSNFFFLLLLLLIFFSGRLYFLLACLFVVYFILNFSRFYMNTSVSPGFFNLLYCGFFTFMVFMLHGQSWYLFFVGWEMMGVFSFLLISWFSSRSLARNRANLAFLSNWLGDLLLFRGLLNRSGLFLIFVAGLTKSAIWLFSSWLPNAMEGPTPVSTLLHSSTMVVARVFLLGILNYRSCTLCVLFLLYGCYMGRAGCQFSDYKRVIAYSTSSQLALVGIISMCGSELQSLSYVEVHAYFKSLLFMLCGWSIHANYTQHVVSSYNYLIIGSSIFWCCAVMCGLPYFSVSRIKDILLIRRVSSFFYLIFMSYAFRTFSYSLLLGLPNSREPLTFLERRFIMFYYLIYLNFSCYVCELLRLRIELGGLPVFLLFILPILFAGILMTLVSSIDYFYKFKRTSIRAYVFGYFLKSGLISKKWFLFVFFFLVYL